MDTQALISTPTLIPSRTAVVIPTTSTIDILSSFSGEAFSVVDLNTRTEGRDPLVLIPNNADEYLLGLKNVPEWSKLIIDGREIKPTHLLVEDRETFSSIPRGTTSAELELVNHDVLDISSKLPKEEPKNKFVIPNEQMKFDMGGVGINIIGATFCSSGGFEVPKSNKVDYYSFKPNQGDSLVVISLAAGANQDKKIKELAGGTVLIDAKDISRQWGVMKVDSVSRLPNAPSKSRIDIAFSVKGVSGAYIYLPKVDQIMVIKHFAQ